MTYKGSELQPPEIAAQLGVENIVEGTVFREEGRVRITANLINASENRNIWSGSFNRSMTGVLALQEEVASEIARQLAGEILPRDIRSEREIDPRAYEAFLKGAYWRNRLTEEGFNRGLLFFQQAIELQPDYAEAYAAMAACHCRLAGHGIEIVKPEIALAESTRLATRALELNDTLAEPNAVLGIIKFKFDWDVDSSIAYLERSLQQNPSLFEAHLWLSQVSEGMGRQELAVEHAELAHRLNPLSLPANLNLGWQLFQAGQMAEAEDQFDRLLEFDPAFWGGHWGKGYIYMDRGQYPEAVAEFNTAVELEGGHTLPLASLGYTYAIAGQRNDALDIIEKLQGMSKNAYVSPLHIAMVYAGLDENDAAFEWLNKSFEVRARAMAWLTVKREFNGLHNDPRYKALVAAIGISSHLPD
jgi:tetratricopeptide (TPR) repeat protein